MVRSVSKSSLNKDISHFFTATFRTWAKPQAKVGGRYRVAGMLLEATDVGGGGVQLTVKATIELEGSERPAAVAETLVRYYF